MKIFSKNEKGSITLFTLIAMMFFLTIAFTAYASAMIKLQAQNEDLERIKASYEQDLTEEGLRELYNKLTGTRQWLPGDGTEQNPYKIYTVEDLLTLSNKVNEGENFSEKYIELMNDLDFKNVNSYEKADRTDFGDINKDGNIEELRIELTTGEGWQVIGKTGTSFNGYFNGNKNEIKGLYMNKTTNLQGLFGYNNGIIQNLIVQGSIESTGSYIGGIAGINNDTSSKVVNCISKIQVTGSQVVGGICGQNKGDIVKCKNINQIQGTLENSPGGNVGGISGTNNGNIENSYNNGNVVAKSNNVGGIAGANMKNVKESVNKGVITCEKYGVGGICGAIGSNDTNIINCCNLSNISCYAIGGGILGTTNNYYCNILQCYSIATVEGISNIHSIIGFGDNKATVSSCYYLSTLLTNDTRATSKTEIEMKSQTFVNLLNLDQENAPWSTDTANINDGYPILRWQLNQ